MKKVANLVDAIENFVGGEHELARLVAGRHFFPGDGRGRGRLVAAAQRVCGGHRSPIIDAGENTLDDLAAAPGAAAGFAWCDRCQSWKQVREAASAPGMTRRQE
ncbi:hypothetical protein K1T34_11455 [Amycolatopsis sp. DSM 110486]|nr:hypothetical protein [Amycolatopsis sp. DSM 110486]QYN23022.1 hypothetical protein K1T34_11455 [Amycolatopsis sp. DSM 110486]